MTEQSLPRNTERFNPKGFVTQLREDITKPGQTEREIIDTTMTLLNGVPFDVFAHVVDQTLHTFAPPEHQREQPPAEQLVFGYLQKILTTYPKDQLPLEEYGLESKYRDSKKENYYRDKFPKLVERRKSASSVIAAIENNWQSLQETTHENEQPADEIIGDQWTKLRQLLDNEITFERTLRNTAYNDAYWKIGHGYNYGKEPLASLTGQIEEQMAKPYGKQKAERSEQITTLVMGLQSIPPQESARVLWEHILTADEKIAIATTRETYDTSCELIASSKSFYSHKDPGYRHMIDTHPLRLMGGDVAAWEKKFIAPSSSLDEIEKVLIGDVGTLSTQTKQAIGHPDRSFTNMLAMNQVELKKLDYLRGYVVDVSTAFLVGELPLAA